MIMHLLSLLNLSEMNIVIVENEPKIAKVLKEYIEEIDQNNNILCICDSIESTVNFLQNNKIKISLFFMDVELADGICFEIFRLTTIKEPVIFCTAHDAYILDAFKSNGIDYILKPFEEKDIVQALLKVSQIKEALEIGTEFSEKIMSVIKPERNFNVSFLVRFREKIYPVHVKDIALISLENEVVYLHTFQKEKHSIFKTIDDIEVRLDNYQFFRINRQMIINRDAIYEMESYFNRKISIKLKIPTSDALIVSRLKVPLFFSWLEKI